MDYLVFDTEKQAATVAQQIFETGANLAAERGHIVDEYGIRAVIDGKPVPESHTRTVNWDVPRQRLDGKWVVRHPKYSAILQSEPALMARLDRALSGVTVETMQNGWFARSVP